MKFLGNEWHISQRSYLTDLLREKHGLKSKKIPITKDQAVMPKDTGTTPPEAIREAQKTVGELLWVVIRTRPDLMYCVSRLASSVRCATSAIKEAGAQSKSYLWNTRGQGLC